MPQLPTTPPQQSTIPRYVVERYFLNFPHSLTATVQPVVKAPVYHPTPVYHPAPTKYAPKSYGYTIVTTEAPVEAEREAKAVVVEEEAPVEAPVEAKAEAQPAAEVVAEAAAEAVAEAERYRYRFF